jgi:hypothetical protein
MAGRSNVKRAAGSAVFNYFDKNGNGVLDEVRPPRNYYYSPHSHYNGQYLTPNYSYNNYNGQYSNLNYYNYNPNLNRNYNNQQYNSPYNSYNNQQFNYQRSKSGGTFVTEPVLRQLDMDGDGMITQNG